MNKYINEMEDYLYNHNYISENNNNVKQQELSVERASCIVQKYRTLTEEKDKEIERLKARETECLNAYRRARQDVTEIESKYILAKYVIDELEKWLNYEIYCDFNKEMTKGYQDTLDKLKELKEGKNE